MKITRVECLVLANEHPIVRVETDEGIVGWGECFRRARAVAKPAIDDFFAPALLDQDPLEVELLHRRLMGMAQVTGPPGSLAVVIAGLDIALWDIRGKALGQPIWKLLGGRVRDRIPVYASSLRRDLSPVEEARRVAGFVEQGYRAYKLHSAVPGRIDDPGDRTLDTVREIRAAVGPDVRLLIDVNGAYSVHHAIDIGRRLEELGAFVFECPVPEHDHRGTRQVADALTIAVAVGESHFTAREFQALLEEGRPDILQPDVVKAAGLTELQKIAQLAALARTPMTAHNTQPTICTAAHLHFCAVHPHVPYEQEYNIEPVSIRDRWPILPGQIEVLNGHIAVPDGPGLGIEVDEKLVRQLVHRTDVQPGH
ncbi:MAG TPA: mandelate racemase/muconate lactonizing enzyme family protein [Chloroflexota bacterium]|nr:mandelate racemase/muconate lactonizing enzyme family protein [Chloroflexota bacterium]